MPYHICAGQSDRYHQDQHIDQYRRDSRRPRGRLRKGQHNEIHDDPNQKPVNYRIDKHSGRQPGDRGIRSKIKTYPAESDEKMEYHASGNHALTAGKCFWSIHCAGDISKKDTRLLIASGPEKQQRCQCIQCTGH